MTIMRRCSVRVMQPELYEARQRRVYRFVFNLTRPVSSLLWTAVVSDTGSMPIRGFERYGDISPTTQLTYSAAIVSPPVIRDKNRMR